MKKGFNLVEMIVAIGILSLVILAFTMVMNNSYKVFSYSQNELKTLNQTTVIMRDFEKTVRGATTFETNTANTLTFFSYLKNDVFPAPSKISYYFEGDNLKKSVIGAVNLSGVYTYPDENKQVSSFGATIGDHNIFTYFDGDSTIIAQPVVATTIRMVKINLTADGKVPSTQTTAVQIRNLKTNL